MRSDLLVSVGVVDLGGPAQTVPRLIALAEGLAAAFRYFEVLYVLPERRRHELDPLAADLARLPNLRVLLSGEGAGVYRQRLLAASEAIGDVVALLDLPSDQPPNPALAILFLNFPGKSRQLTAVLRYTALRMWEMTLRLRIG